MQIHFMTFIFVYVYKWDSMMRFKKIRWDTWWPLGELCEVPSCLPWRGLRCHCPMYSVSLYLVFSSVNISIFHLYGWIPSKQTPYLNLLIICFLPSWRISHLFLFWKGVTAILYLLFLICKSSIIAASTILNKCKWKLNDLTHVSDME